MTNELNLQEGTTLVTCSSCNNQFVAFEELKENVNYCSEKCEMEHSFFTEEELKAFGVI